MENWLAEEFGSIKAFNYMYDDVQDIKDKYPVNHWKGENEKEFARFENATIYEALENGKTIEEARIDAMNLTITFMDVDNKMANASLRNFQETLVKAGRADPEALNQEIIQTTIDLDSPDRSIMDLRKYGIEGNWVSHNIYEGQKAMTDEIEKKINQFNFMLNNEDLMKAEYEKLDGHYHDTGNNAGYKSLINDKYMPMMQEALNVFKNYKIYE